MEDWWTTEDDKAFKEKTKLMKEQVESYLYIDIEEQKEYHINPELTMGENLADLGGISLSLQAMNSVLEKENKSTDEVKLNQRVFFKSFANIWKENIKKETLINQLTTNPHSPGHFRANLVHNMAEFYTVFDISETDRMYLPPSRRLRMW
uniref:Peptidase M13 C-terminal domain-containing protein n=1 Tax=Arcella intermedia TaxID=1963864 RepID=A0A6B2LKQ2_9EUKA